MSHTAVYIGSENWKAFGFHSKRMLWIHFQWFWGESGVVARFLGKRESQMLKYQIEAIFGVKFGSKSRGEIKRYCLVKGKCWKTTPCCQHRGEWQRGMWVVSRERAGRVWEEMRAGGCSWKGGEANLSAEGRKEGWGKSRDKEGILRQRRGKEGTCMWWAHELCEFGFSPPFSVHAPRCS